ncbi:Abi family protein, partial [bacterium]|nr:Abi family protein [bacterium]
KHLNEINNDIINLPFILLDDTLSKYIAKSLFENSFSKQSFFDENTNQFIFNNYFSFLINYINPFNKNSYSINNDFCKFFFPKIQNNFEIIKKERKKLIEQYYLNENEILQDKYQDRYIEVKNEFNNKSITCTFSNLLKSLKEKKTKNQINKNNEDKYEERQREITINNAINILSKSFIPLYKSFTQISFGDMINFFCRLNENIQIAIIKTHFKEFYKGIYEKISDKKELNLIMISAFISYLNLFKNLRNRVAHHDAIYNF